MYETPEGCQNHSASSTKTMTVQFPTPVVIVPEFEAKINEKWPHVVSFTLLFHYCDNRAAKREDILVGYKQTSQRQRQQASDLGGIPCQSGFGIVLCAKRVAQLYNGAV